MLDIVALAVLLVVLAALINYFRPLRRAHSKPCNSDAHRYHAVAIGKNTAACAASMQLVGKRFLSKEAPSLPVAGCDANTCRCRYVHYEDRRGGEDRRFPFGVRRSSEPNVADSERRRGDRRKTDGLVLT